MHAVIQSGRDDHRRDDGEAAAVSGGMNDHAGAIFKGFQRLFRLQHYIAFGRPTRHLGTFATYSNSFLGCPVIKAAI